MSSKVISAAIIGLDCEKVEVEADLFPSFRDPFIVVGLPDTAVKESKERVRSAIKNSNFDFPRQRVIINLAPADLQKEGPSYDLPIAVSILAMRGYLKTKSPNLFEKSLFVGELSLDGSLRGINGALSIAIFAKAKKYENLFLPSFNADEASIITGINIYPVDNLSQLADHLIGKTEIISVKNRKIVFEFKEDENYDMAFIKGQEHVKRAMEIAAAGAHNILFCGTPGAGKTLLARTMPTIMPQLTFEEALEVTRIYSISGHLKANQPLILHRQFRSPHHTSSGVALVGGGRFPKPGEITLAHRGVLFLDEFPEFPRATLENLRQPLEDGVITVSRASGSVMYPAKFILIAAQNPCPCGYFGDPEKECTCNTAQILKYQKKISGPLLDRIDLHIDVPRVKFEKLSSDKTAENSKEIRQRVQKARDIQINRFKEKEIWTNSEMLSKDVKEFCQIDNKTQELLKNAVIQLHLSARSYYRVLKISRTIADLAGDENIRLKYVAEALQYRPKIE
ncbi:YifB family Mg chelatase-like AAA ATPase [Candidatus Falkowbacteria bacterium]|nr:YifB family Mg chelatase-like AAA ATPase [Candidatus Falkowbacteria bacterium]